MTRELTNVERAVRLLGVYSAGRFDIWALAGSARGSQRAHVLSALAGVKVPQSKAGVNAIRSALYEAIGITGECEAHREDSFILHCRSMNVYPNRDLDGIPMFQEVHP